MAIDLKTGLALLRRYRRWILAAALVVALLVIWLFAKVGEQAAIAESAARADMRIGRYDLALEKLGEFSLALDGAPEQAQPLALLLRWWPGIRSTREIAELGLILSRADPDVESHGQRLGELLRKHPGDPDVHLLRAVGLLREHDPAQMKSHLDAALKADPAHAEAHNQRGIALEHLDGNLSAAADSYRKAAELAPASEQYRGNLAAARLAMGDYPVALAEYRGISRLTLARVEEAKAYWGLGQWMQAQARLEDALEQLAGDKINQEYPNRRAWEFYFGLDAYGLAEPEHKRCYVQLALSAAQALAGTGRFSVAACAASGKNRDWRELLADDLCRYVVAEWPGSPAAQTAGEIRRALGGTKTCGDA